MTTVAKRSELRSASPSVKSRAARETEMWAFPCNLIDDLLDASCADPDADACTRLAAVFRNMAAHVQREIEGGTHEPTAETQDLMHELHRVVRNIADSCSVPLAWMPTASSHAINNQQVFHMLAGFVETLDYLARRPELRRRHGSE
jgi:hypothetical protein